MEKISKNKNHEKAPICAAFVKLMRETFGDDVRVLWVKEGNFEIGAPVKNGIYILDSHGI